MRWLTYESTVTTYKQLLESAQGGQCFFRYPNSLVDVGFGVGERITVMAGSAAVIVEVNATLGRLPTKLQHRLPIMTQALPIVCHRLARAENNPEPAAVMLKSAGCSGTGRSKSRNWRPSCLWSRGRSSRT